MKNLTKTISAILKGTEIKEEIEDLKGDIIIFNELIKELENSELKCIAKNEEQFAKYKLYKRIIDCKTMIKMLKKQLKQELTLIQRILKFLRLI